MSWSHYLILMRISKIEERHFYEIEHIEMAGVKMNWHVSMVVRYMNVCH